MGFAFSGGTPTYTEPAWVTQAVQSGWAVGEWLAISGAAPTAGYGLSATNTMLAVNTAGDSQSALNEAFVDSWTGAALCSGHRNYGTMMYGPGGSHNQYSKGTIYCFDLETRTWEEVAGADASGFDVDAAFGEYTSGRPVTNHSAHWPFYDSNRNEFAYPKGWGSPTSGSDQYPKTYGHGLSLTAYDANGYADSQWRRYPELTGLTGVGGATPSDQLKGLGQQCGCAWDASRNAAWIVTAFSSVSTSGVVAKYDSALNTWTQYAQQWRVFIGSAYAIDPVRDLLVMPQSGNAISIMDLSQPDLRFGSPTSTSAFWTATETGAAKPSTYSQMGWAWSEARQGFIWYRWQDSTTQVKLAQYDSGGASFANGVQTDYTLVWSDLLAGTNAVTLPAHRSAGAYNKFQLARWGSREIAFFCPDVGGPMYAFRVN